MDLIILAIGAYLAWRLLAKNGSKPSQEPPEPPPLEPDIPPMFIEQRRVFLVERFAPLINSVAESLRMPPNILKALIYMQSGGDDAARVMQPDSEYGYGLTQITCSRARRLSADAELKGVTPISDCLDLETPVNSIYYGAVYLNALNRGDWLTALAKYYSPREALIPRADALKKAGTTLAVANAWTYIN